MQSQSYYIRSDDPIGFADMILTWSQKGYPSEIDLFIARGVFL